MQISESCDSFEAGRAGGCGGLPSRPTVAGSQSWNMLWLKATGNRVSKIQWQIASAAWNHYQMYWVCTERSIYTVGQRSAAFRDFTMSSITNQAGGAGSVKAASLSTGNNVICCSSALKQQIWNMTQSLCVWCLSFRWPGSISLWSQGRLNEFRRDAVREFCQRSDKMSKDVKQMPWQVTQSLNSVGRKVNLSPIT